MLEGASPAEAFEDRTFGDADNAKAVFGLGAFTSYESPGDDVLAGGDDALSPEAQRGANLFFGPAQCSVCHDGPNLSDEDFHNIGMPQIGPGTGSGINGQEDFGLEEATGNPRDRYRFRTPPLRNVALTAPYGHAGQFIELRDMIAHYGNPRASFDNYDTTMLEPVLWNTMVDNEQALFARLAPPVQNIRINGQQITELEAFLEALTDPNMVNLDSVVPDSVPSGLPVAD